MSETINVATHVVCCRGELLSQQGTDAAIAGLVKKFSISRQQAENLVLKDYQFQRHTDYYTAKQYQRLFQRLGLKSSVEIVSAMDSVLDKVTLIERAEVSAKSSAKGIEQSAYEKSKSARYTRPALVSAAFLFLVVSNLDELGKVESLPALASLVSSTIGFLYVLIFCALLAGCAFLAESKGHSKKWGLASLLGFAGLGLVLLLPAGEGSSKSSKVEKFAALSCLILGLWWWALFISDTGALSWHAYKMNDLADGRSSYPTQVIDSDKTIESELAEFEAHFIALTDLFETTTPNRNRLAAIAGEMFNQGYLLIGWLNYQQYLHVQQEQKLPEQLTPESISLYTNQIRTMLEAYGATSSYAAYVYEFINWHTPASNAETDLFARQVEAVSASIMFSQPAEMIFSGQEGLFPAYLLTGRAGLDIVSKNNVITLTSLNNDDLSLTVAVYKKPKLAEQRYQSKLAVIYLTGSLHNRYFKQGLNYYFKDYAPLPTFGVK